MAQRPPIYKPNMDDSFDSSPDGDQIFASMSQLQFDFLRHKIAVTKGSERRDTRRELLLKMGAKPEKKGSVNYRLLINQKKVEKEDARIAMLEENLKSATHKKLGKKRKDKKKDKKSKKSAGITKISRDRIRSVRNNGMPSRNRNRRNR